MRTLLAVLTAVLAVGVVRADDADKAKATVEKAVKAAGWEKNGAEVNRTWKDKGVLHLGGAKLEYTGETWFSGPDKFRLQFAGSFGGMDINVTAVTNGHKAWESDGHQTRAVSDEKLEYTRTQVYYQRVYTLTPLLSDKGFTLKAIDGVKVDKAETTGVEVTHKDKPAVKLYFDAKSGLLAKAEVTVKNEFEGWRETTDELTFSEWKAGEDKKLYPTKSTLTRGGSLLIETEQSGHKLLEKADAKLFEELK
jgi:outer membrane lipoprotein-sorting protein